VKTYNVFFSTQNIRTWTVFHNMSYAEHKTTNLWSSICVFFFPIFWCCIISKHSIIWWQVFRTCLNIWETSFYMLPKWKSESKCGKKREYCNRIFFLFFFLIFDKNLHNTNTSAMHWEWFVIPNYNLIIILILLIMYI